MSGGKDINTIHTCACRYDVCTDERERVIYIYIYGHHPLRHTDPFKTLCEHLPVSRVVMYSISLLGCFACMYKA